MSRQEEGVIADLTLKALLSSSEPIAPEPSASMSLRLHANIVTLQTSPCLQPNCCQRLPEALEQLLALFCSELRLQSLRKTL